MVWQAKLLLSCAAVAALGSSWYGAVVGGRIAKKIAPPTRVTFVFCGCDKCARAVAEFNVQRARSPRSEILFLGPPEDAHEFTTLHHLAVSVRCDVAGWTAKQMGVTECPSVVISRAGAVMVLGNGKAFSVSDRKEVLEDVKP